MTSELANIIAGGLAELFIIPFVFIFIYLLITKMLRQL